MKKDPYVYLLHILESIGHIERSIANRSGEEFLKNTELQDAIIRRIQIIGEAAKLVPEDFKKVNGDIPWKKMAGMRDKVVHDYFEVDLELVWQVVTRELPALQILVKDLLAKRPDGNV